MSAQPVDVLSVLDNAQALVFEPGKRGEEWATLIAQSRDAVRELIEVVESTFPRNLCATNPNISDSTIITLIATYGELRKLHAALARCKGGAK